MVATWNAGDQLASSHAATATTSERASERRRDPLDHAAAQTSSSASVAAPMRELGQTRRGAARVRQRADPLEVVLGRRRQPQPEEVLELQRRDHRRAMPGGEAGGHRVGDELR